MKTEISGVASVLVHHAHHPVVEERPMTTLTQMESGSGTTSNIDVDLEAQGGDVPVHDGSHGNQRKRSTLSRFKPSPRMFSDLTIGLSDGMTVPFALTAGLSFLGSTHLVVLGGVAELLAGAISMAIGGYLSARGEA